MNSRTICHRRAEVKRSAKPLAVLALSIMLLFFSGCAAVGGGISQMQNDDEEPTNAERTENSEPRTTQTDDGEATTEEDAATSVSAGDASVETGDDGSVVVRAGDAEVTTGPGGAVARAGDVVAEPGAGSPDASSGERSGAAILRLAGNPGTAFSGACVAGGEPRVLDGETPSRLDFDLDDSGLACDIEKSGDGNLRVVLTAGADEVVRETNAEGATISLVYRGGNIVASQSSNSVSSNSQSSSSVSSSSSVQSQSSSSSTNQSVSVTN